MTDIGHHAPPPMPGNSPYDFYIPPAPGEKSNAEQFVEAVIANVEDTALLTITTEDKGATVALYHRDSEVSFERGPEDLALVYLMLSLTAREGGAVLLSLHSPEEPARPKESLGWIVRPTRHVEEPIYRPVSPADLSDIYAYIKDIIAEETEDDPVG